MANYDYNNCNGGNYSSDHVRGMAIASSPSRSHDVNGGANSAYILHPVSKFDTLAGVAIKYGVEVTDIKRLNGLVTDLQMFALKTLQIPLPGRHSPSPCLCENLDTPQRLSSSEETPSRSGHIDLFVSFQSVKLKSSQQKASPELADGKARSEGFETAVYRKEAASHNLEDFPFSEGSVSNPPLRHHRKSKSAANGFLPNNDDLTNQVSSQEAQDNDNNNTWIEKLVRKVQKSVGEYAFAIPELLMKEDNSSSGGGFSTITGKGLALRPKSVSRTISRIDMEAGRLKHTSSGLVDFPAADTVGRVRKSLSTPSFQDSDTSMLSSIWPTTSKWSLKPDFQAFSTAAITRPIFDGLPKPIGRKNKAALD